MIETFLSEVNFYSSRKWGRNQYGLLFIIMTYKGLTKLNKYASLLCRPQSGQTWEVADATRPNHNSGFRRKIMLALFIVLVCLAVLGFVAYIFRRRLKKFLLVSTNEYPVYFSRHIHPELRILVRSAFLRQNLYGPVNWDGQLTVEAIWYFVLGEPHPWSIQINTDDLYLTLDRMKTSGELVEIFVSGDTPLTYKLVEMKS